MQKTRSFDISSSLWLWHCTGGRQAPVLAELRVLSLENAPTCKVSDEFVSVFLKSRTEIGIRHQQHYVSFQHPESQPSEPLRNSQNGINKLKLVIPCSSMQGRTQPIDLLVQGAQIFHVVASSSPISSPSPLLFLFLGR